MTCCQLLHVLLTAFLDAIHMTCNAPPAPAEALKATRSVVRLRGPYRYHSPTCQTAQTGAAAERVVAGCVSEQHVACGQLLSGEDKDMLALTHWLNGRRQILKTQMCGQMAMEFMLVRRE
jgi:hypothetical protein